MFRFEKLRIDRPRLPPGSWSAYLSAIALVAAAVLLRWLVGPLLHNVPILTFYPAVILATFLGGLASGLLAVALASLAAWFFFLSPAFSFRIAELSHAVGLIAFVLVAVANVGIVGALQTALARLRSLTDAERARDAQELRRLADALHHAAFAIAIVDSRTNAIQFANPAFAALRGTTVPQLKGTNILDAYSPAERERMRVLFDQADRTGRMTADSEYVRADGSVLPAQESPHFDRRITATWLAVTLWDAPCCSSRAASPPRGDPVDLP